MDHSYKFDRIFMPDATQTHIFDMISPMLQCAIDGHDICIFAYGQTGKLQLHLALVFSIFSFKRTQFNEFNMSLIFQDRAKHLR